MLRTTRKTPPLTTGKKKIQELKERSYRAVFRKRERRCWSRRGEDICVNLFRVRNEDTPENQIEYMDSNGKKYNSKFIFKETASMEKKMADLFKKIVRDMSN